MNKVDFIEYIEPKIRKNGQKLKMAKYRCFCGQEFASDIYHVKSGDTSSCGCFKSKATSERRRIIYEVGSLINGLKYLGEDIYNKNGRTALFECKCGKEFRALIQGVKASKTKSCGCLKLEMLDKRNTKHGSFHSKEYKAWAAMKYRCYNPNSNRYKYYGAKGKTVCDRWLHSFENFYKDMGDMPADGYTVERNDPFGNYEPSNCKWDLKTNQPKNKTNTLYIEYDFKKVRLMDLVERTGVNYTTLKGRLKGGWNLDKAFDYKLTNLFLNV